MIDKKYTRIDRIESENRKPTEATGNTVETSRFSKVVGYNNKVYKKLVELGMLEVTYLKNVSTDIKLLVESNKASFGAMNETLNKYLDGQAITNEGVRSVGLGIIELTKYIKSNGDLQASLLKDNNTALLKLVSLGGDAEVNESRLMNMFNSISLDIEDSGIRNQQILDTLRSMNLKTPMTKKEDSPDKKGISLDMFSKLYEELKKYLNVLAPGAILAGTILLSVAKPIIKMVGNLIKNAVSSVGKTIYNKAGEAGKYVYDKAKDVGKTVYNKAKDIGKVVFDKAKDVGKTVYNKAKDVGKVVFDKAKGYGKTVFDKARGLGRNVVSRVAPVISSAGRGVTSVGSKLATVASRGAGFLKYAAKGAGLVGLGLTAVDFAMNLKEEFFGKDADKKTTMEKVRNATTKTFGDMLEGISFGFLNSKDIQKGLTTFGDAIGEMASRLWTIITGKLTEWWDYLSNKGKDVENKVKVTMPVVKDAVKTALTTNPIKEGGVLKTAKDYYSNTGFAKWMGEKASDAYNYATGGGGGSSASADDFNPPSVGQTKEGTALASAAQSGAYYKSLGKCYGYVWNAIQKTGLDKKGVAPTNDPNSAFRFAEWADTSAGQSKLARVFPSVDAKGNLINAMPGDIIVYGSGKSNSGSYAGHIEVLGNDGSAYSDFKDSGAKQFRGAISSGKLARGDMKVYRYKGTPLLSTAEANKILNKDVKGKDVKTKESIKTSNTFKDGSKLPLATKEEAGGASIFKGMSDKTASLSGVVPKPTSAPKPVLPNISIPSVVKPNQRMMNKRVSQLGILAPKPTTSSVVKPRVSIVSTPSEKVGYRQDLNGDLVKTTDRTTEPVKYRQDLMGQWVETTERTTTPVGQGALLSYLSNAYSDPVKRGVSTDGVKNVVDLSKNVLSNSSMGSLGSRGTGGVSRRSMDVRAGTVTKSSLKVKSENPLGSGYTDMSTPKPVEQVSKASTPPILMGGRGGSSGGGSGGDFSVSTGVNKMILDIFGWGYAK